MELIKFGPNLQYQVYPNRHEYKHFWTWGSEESAERFGTIIYIGYNGRVCYRHDAETHEHMVSFVGGDGGSMTHRMPDQFKDEILFAAITFYCNLLNQPFIFRKKEKG